MTTNANPIIDLLLREGSEFLSSPGEYLVLLDDEEPLEGHPPYCVETWILRSIDGDSDDLDLFSVDSHGSYEMGEKSEDGGYDADVAAWVEDELRIVRCLKIR